MKFIPLRELRNHPQAVLKKLKSEKEIIITSHGKPVARMGDLAEETFEEDMGRYRNREGKSSSRAHESAAPYFVDDPEILNAWIIESERRWEDYLSGKTKAIPAEKALAKIRKQLKKK